MFNVKGTLELIWSNVLISQVNKQKPREVESEGSKAESVAQAEHESPTPQRMF